MIKLEIDLVFFGQNSEIILIDITFDDSAPDKSGTHLGKATLDLTKDLMVLYPHLQYIALVIKQLLYSHNLNSAYLGGLSSYSLNLWIAAFMNSISQVSQDLGEVLLQFLDFYGNSFNSDTTGISILNGGSFYSLPKLHYEPIVTIDPINHSNNTTRTSYRVKDVLRLFSETHAKLIELKDKKRKDLLKQIFRAS